MLVFFFVPAAALADAELVWVDGVAVAAAPAAEFVLGMAVDVMMLAELGLVCVEELYLRPGATVV